MRILLLGMVVSVVLTVGGCFRMSNPADKLDGPALSDAQVRAQIVEPLRQIVRTSGTTVLGGSFSYSSCSDQNKPPYRGRGVLRFAIPAGTDAQASLDKVVSAMVSLGWDNKAPEGKKPQGRALNKDGVMAIVTTDQGAGFVSLYGDCRNLTDHKALDQLGHQDITADLEP